MNIVEEIRSQNYDSLLAVKSGTDEISFEALFEGVSDLTKIIQVLLDRIDSPVPRIGVKFPDGLSYLIVALSVLECGACFVPIPDELTAHEEDDLIRKTALHALIKSTGPDLSDFQIVELEPSEPSFPVTEFEALNPAFIRFSSGTTGSSKGVVISHESLLARIKAANRGLCLSAGDRVLWTLPMAHHFAVTIINYLYHGVATILPPSHEPDAIFTAAKTEEVHLLYGSPFHFTRLATCRSATPIPSLKLAVSTATALTQETADAFFRAFQVPLTQAFGIIEVGLPILNLQDANSQPLALGQLLPDYQMRIIDGELHLSGPGMYDAYLTPWQTRTDRWFATGDLVKEKNGTIVLIGRKKSVLNVAGMKVFPEEIESIIMNHPAILEARVRGEPHATMGSYPLAEIVVTSSKDAPSMRELRSYCSQYLAGYKLPLEVREVPQIDRTPNGKIKRY